MKRIRKQLKYKPGTELFDLVIACFEEGVYSYPAIYRRTKVPHYCYVTALSYYLKTMQTKLEKFEEGNGIEPHSFKTLLRYEDENEF